MNLCPSCLEVELQLKGEYYYHISPKSIIMTLTSRGCLVLLSEHTFRLMRKCFQQLTLTLHHRLAQSVPARRLVPYVIDSAVKLRIDALAMTEPIRDKETDRQEVYRQAER